MTSPWGNPPQLPKPPSTWPAAAPEATAATLGEHPAPDAYLQPVTLPPHAPGLLPLTDPALDGAA